MKKILRAKLSVLLNYMSMMPQSKSNGILSNLLLSTQQTETDTVSKRMLFLLEEKFLEFSASAVESGGEGLVLSFEKVSHPKSVSHPK